MEGDETKVIAALLGGRFLLFSCFVYFLFSDFVVAHFVASAVAQAHTFGRSSMEGRSNLKKARSSLKSSQG